MAKLETRLQALESASRPKGRNIFVWRNKGESDEQARRRAGVPDDTGMVVIISWLSGELPEEKRGALAGH